MQKIFINIKPHQQQYLEKLTGTPPYLGTKYNFSHLIFSLLTWKETDTNEYTKILVPDWVIKKSGGKCHISAHGHKIIGSYIDSLLDLHLFNYLKPYLLQSKLSLKDGIYSFIYENNLDDEQKIFEMLKKRYYRMRKKFPEDNKIKFFNNLSPKRPYNHAV